VKNSSKLPLEEKQKKSNLKSEEDHLFDLMEKAEKGIEESRRDKNYVLGQKIPGHVKEFSRQEMGDQHFSAKHSSVLRILTKWN
jgi:hypothetical protein